MYLSKLVYIAGPYTAPTKLGVEANVNEARKAAVWCAEHRIFYFCPHLNSGHFELWAPEVPVSFYYEMDLAILNRCDVMLVLDGWYSSKGTMAEIDYCKLHQIPYFYGFDGLLHWHQLENM
jgi:nucleoside 2-deoxyribosyltransferase